MTNEVATALRSVIPHDIPHTFMYTSHICTHMDSSNDVPVVSKTTFDEHLISILAEVMQRVFLKEPRVISYVFY